MGGDNNSKFVETVVQLVFKTTFSKKISTDGESRQESEKSSYSSQEVSIIRKNNDNEDEDVFFDTPEDLDDTDVDSKNIVKISEKKIVPSLYITKPNERNIQQENTISENTTDAKLEEIRKELFDHINNKNIHGQFANKVLSSDEEIYSDQNDYLKPDDVTWSITEKKHIDTPLPYIFPYQELEDIHKPSMKNILEFMPFSVEPERLVLETQEPKTLPILLFFVFFPRPRMHLSSEDLNKLEKASRITGKI